MEIDKDYLLVKKEEENKGSDFFLKNGIMIFTAYTSLRRICCRNKHEGADPRLNLIFQVNSRLHFTD